MRGRRIWEIGGFISGAVLIVFGAVALYMGVNGYQTVGDEPSKEYIVGESDMRLQGATTPSCTPGAPRRTENRLRAAAFGVRLD